MSKYKILNKQSRKSFTVSKATTVYSCMSQFDFKREAILTVDDCALAEDVLNYQRSCSKRELEELNKVIEMYEMEPDGGEFKVMEFYAASICGINHETKECLINFEWEMFFMGTEFALKEYPKFEKAKEIHEQMKQWGKIRADI